MAVAQAVDIEVDREHEVRIRYDDGVLASFPVRALREHCPCAGCRGRRDQGQPVFTGETITIRDAHLHGNWGVAIEWSDGHDTGIYAWSLLRTWWDTTSD